MDFSSVSKPANGSVPSPDGTLVASIVSHKLVIRSASDLRVQRIIPLNPTFTSKIKFMKWSPVPQSDNTSIEWNGFMCKRRSGIYNSAKEGDIVQRVLLADDETILVFDANDEKWTATISQGFGGIRNVEFGRNADEVVVFSDFQIKVTVWNLVSSKHIEIANPKFSNTGFGYRPYTSHFAILTRSNAHDVVSIHQNTTYNISASVTLPTSDAQGLRWSPCGRWLAIWDSPTVGYKVLVYTADGHLYRTHEKQCDGLGVKTVEWSPSSNFLTVGSYDGKMCFLSNYTFSPVISMSHTRTVKLHGVQVWSEHITSQRDRYYAPAQQPTTLPTVPFNPLDGQLNAGISTMAFSNPDGTLVATKNDSMPSTVWVWSIQLLQPYAILVHLNPIKSMSWHPTIPELLLIQCEPNTPTNDDPSPRQSGVVYLWSSAWARPRTVLVPMEKVTSSMWAKWVLKTSAHQSNNSYTRSTSLHSISPDQLNHQYCRTSSQSPEKAVDKRPMLLFGDKEGFMVGYVEEEPILPNQDVEEEVQPGIIVDATSKKNNYAKHQGQNLGSVDWDAYSPNTYLR